MEILVYFLGQVVVMRQVEVGNRLPASAAPPPSYLLCWELGGEEV